MGKIGQNKEKKKQDILMAAQEIFLSEGYVLASMNKIAAQAQVTKQTVYRYFPSKIDLFQATLNQMGENYGASLHVHLKNPNIKEALLGVANDIINFHLSDEHLATYRLLVAESGKAPEITSRFLATGPDDMVTTLAPFFSERLKVDDVESVISLWTSMLLDIRSGVLMGMKKPSNQKIVDHAKKATDFLLAAIS